MRIIMFECLEAATGEEGIEIIERENPDIVLLDNKLPGMSGMQVLEYIRQKNPRYDGGHDHLLCFTGNRRESHR